MNLYILYLSISLPSTVFPGILIQNLYSISSLSLSLSLSLPLSASVLSSHPHIHCPPVRGWQGLIAQGCHSSILIVDPKTSQTIQVLERHKANVVKVSLNDACNNAALFKTPEKELNSY